MELLTFLKLFRIKIIDLHDSYPTLRQALASKRGLELRNQQISIPSLGSSPATPVKTWEVTDTVLLSWHEDYSDLSLSDEQIASFKENCLADCQDYEALIFLVACRKNPFKILFNRLCRRNSATTFYQARVIWPKGKGLQSFTMIYWLEDIFLLRAGKRQLLIGRA